MALQSPRTMKRIDPKSDQQANQLARAALERAYIDTRHVRLRFESGRVRVTGRVNSMAQRNFAEEVVRVACWPRLVDNELDIASAPPPHVSTAEITWV